MTGWMTVLKGMGLGLAMAAPVGPIGLLCIRRSLAQGRWIGLATEAAPLNGRGLLGAYGSTLVLTLTNPATILSFFAIFAGMGLLSADPDREGALALVLGVFLGSALWWVCLSWGVTFFSPYLTPSRLIWLNRLAGAAIFAFGIVALGTLLF